MADSINPQEKRTRSPKTERVNVTLIDGEECEVRIKYYLDLPKRYELLQDNMDEVKMEGGELTFAPNMMSIIPAIARAVWADKNVTVADVEASSLQEVIEQRLDRFLGQALAQGQAGDSEGGGSQENQQPGGGDGDGNPSPRADGSEHPGDVAE